MSYSKADIEKILTLLSASDVTALSAEDFDHFQYQGFDPIKLAGTLLSVKNKHNIKDQDFRNDVLKMVAIGMIKGSITETNLNKMSDAGKADVTALNTKYGIKVGGGRGQPSTTVTYPRVMATFPDVAVKMTQVIGGKEFNGGPMLSTRLPSYMQVQVFPSVIPRNTPERARRMLLTASLCYSIDQSVQISQLKDPNLMQLASTQSNFTMVGHNSPVPSAAARLAVFNDLSLSKDYDMILPVLKDYKEKVDQSFDIMTKSDFVSEVMSLK